MKKMILVTSPPACGKTFVTKKLAKAMPNCVTLIKIHLLFYQSRFLLWQMKNTIEAQISLKQH